MRRLSGLLLAGGLVLAPAFSHGHAGAQAGQAQPATAQTLTFDGEVALWSVSIRPEKTADFEQVATKLKEALAKSEKAERKQQGAGWKIMKGAKMPDGNIVYTHIICPVVPGADYRVMQILYESFTDPAEQKRLFDLYSGAFAGNLSRAVGSLVVDLGKTQ